MLYDDVQMDHSLARDTKVLQSICRLIGADPGFSFGGGGGGAKDYVPERTLWARNRTHFRQGSRARLTALEALGLFKCSLVLSDKKKYLKNIVDQIFFFGGAPVVPPPPGSATAVIIRMSVTEYQHLTNRCSYG